MQNSSSQRRRFPRLACSLPVQLRAAGQSYFTACETTDISPCGCYVRVLFPFPVGTVLDIRIGIQYGEVEGKATVKTTDPALGNGIEFTQMAPAQRLRLQQHLGALPQEEAESGKIFR